MKMKFKYAMEQATESLLASLFEIARPAEDYEAMLRDRIGLQLNEFAEQVFDEFEELTERVEKLEKIVYKDKVEGGK